MTEPNSPSRELASERLLFVTGRLAEDVVRRVVEDLSTLKGFRYQLNVVSISVAALMHVDWLLNKLTITGTYDRVFVPGWCQGELSRLEQKFGVAFERGPKDILDLPQFLGQQARGPIDLSTFNIEIIAEINHAPRMSDAEIVLQATHYRNNGADVIDIGCIPGESWSRGGNVVRRLKHEGFRISIDSFDQTEVENAVENGAELVLSCNSSNVSWASQLGVELVVIPDTPSDPSSLEMTLEQLNATGAKYRIDPILEPIGFHFAASLARFYEVRKRYPDVPMMMGVGNLTEMTEVDSAGLNVMLAAICEELSIFSILTTEVINWAGSAVKEFDLARRLMKHAVTEHALPKHVSSDLVMLRDARVQELGEEALHKMASQLKDPNYRIFVERDELHIMNRDGYWRGTDAFELFERFSKDAQLDVSHAFYLGYELCKAVTALTLKKQYRQDNALQWGFLTIPETSVHERRKSTRTS